jgi:hypothetical protein
MKKLLLTLVLACGLISVSAQYRFAAGAALGLPSGLSVKTFIHKKTALDFTLGLTRNYYGFSAMFEPHASVRRWYQMYWGPGIHAGYWRGEDYGKGAFGGVDFTGGLEFKPVSIPMTFSFDLRPGVNVFGNSWEDENHWFFLQAQFAVRYIIKN